MSLMRLLQQLQRNELPAGSYDDCPYMGLYFVDRDSSTARLYELGLHTYNVCHQLPTSQVSTRGKILTRSTVCIPFSIII